MTASVLKQDPKGPNECLFILSQTHGMQIFREIPFIEPENDTWTTDKRLKTMKNERNLQALNKLQKLNQNKMSPFLSFFIILTI